MDRNHSLDRLFRALGDPTRLRLLNLMAAQEVCVCYFTEVIGAPQPKISRHLAYLRKAGIVAARREGKWMHYRLSLPSNPHAAAIVETVLAALKQDEQLQRDCQRFNRACCGPKSLVRLLGAPVPTLSGAGNSEQAGMAPSSP
jgi:ArsR family transcriptional regulator, arsenate/arsenite/antimonite-responsive transcriptional repressor